MVQANPQKPAQLIPVAPRFPDATTQIPVVSGQQTGAPVEGDAPLARVGPGRAGSGRVGSPGLPLSDRLFPLQSWSPPERTPESPRPPAFIPDP